MNARDAYQARAALVLELRNAGRTLREVAAILRLKTRDEARKLEARGRALQRAEAKR